MLSARLKQIKGQVPRLMVRRLLPPTAAAILLAEASNPACSSWWTFPKLAGHSVLLAREHRTACEPSRYHSHARSRNRCDSKPYLLPGRRNHRRLFPKWLWLGTLPCPRILFG